MYLSNYDLSKAVIGAGFSVHSALGPGLLEKVYEKALCVALRNDGISFECQKYYPVVFQDELVGEYYADLVIENEIIVELKSVVKVLPIHYSQLKHYLKIAKIDTGLLINFNSYSLEYHRLNCSG